MSNIVIKNCPLRKDCEWDCEECGIVAQAIAANNKWWVERLNKLQVPYCYEFSKSTKTCSYAYHPIGGQCPCHYAEIQQIKKEATDER